MQSTAHQHVQPITPLTTGTRMQRKAGRLKAMLIVFLSISFALLICVLYYFYQIQENEKYQNQLHFRELNNITVSLENGINAFSSYIEQREKSVTAREESQTSKNEKVDLDNNFSNLYKGMVRYIEKPDAKLTRYQENRDLLEKRVGFYKRIAKAKSKVKETKENLPRIDAWKNDLSTQRAKIVELARRMQQQDAEVVDLYLKQRSVDASYSPSDDGVLTRAKYAVSQVKSCIENKAQNQGDFNKCFGISYDTSIVLIYYFMFLTKSDVITTGDNKSSPLRNLQRTDDIRKNGFAQYQIAVGSAEVNNDSHSEIEEGSSTQKVSLEKNKFEFWTVPIEDWLGGSKTLYPLVLLVNHEGKTVARKQNARVNSSLIGIEFSDLKDILDEKGKPEDTKSLVKAGFISASKEVSKFVDVKIAGNEYRLFVSPFINQRLLNATDEQKTFYVVGLREKSAFDSTKLSISRSQVTGFVFFTLALIALIPLLKIRLSSVSQAFSAWDRHALAVGSILLITVITIGLYDYVKYGQVKQNQDKLNQSIFMQMRNAFNLELEEMLKIVSENLPQELPDSESLDNVKDESVIDNLDPVLNKSDTKISNYTLNPKLTMAFKDELLINNTQSPFFVENMFVLNGEQTLEKSVKLDGFAKWSTTNRFRGQNREISLAKRDYAVRGVKNDLWPVDYVQPISNCQPGLFIERLFNLRDGAKSAQLVMSCGDKNAFGFYDALSFGTQIQTLTNAVLPKNYGFVVFENATGRALYHSDDANRSLVENLLVETGNNAFFNTLINSPFLLDQPVLLDVDYSGKEHRFAVGSLKKGIPWTLVVFYDKEEARAVNLMAVLVTLSICFIAFLFLYFLSIMLIPKSKRRHLFWPTPVDNARNTQLLMIGVLVGATALFGGMSLLIANQVFEHHEIRLSQIHHAALSQEVAITKNDVNRYRNAVLDSKSAFVESQASENNPEKGPNSLTLFSDTNVVSSALCFLGKQTPFNIRFTNSGSPNSNSRSLQLCQASVTDTTLSENLSNESNIGASTIESLWKYSVLDGDIDESLNVISYLDNIHERDEEAANNPPNKFEMHNGRDEVLLYEAQSSTSSSILISVLRFIMQLIILFAAVLFIYKVAKDWIFNRFFGFNIPPFFRLRSTTRYDVVQALADKFFASKDNMMVVRAKLSTRLNIVEPKQTPSNPFYESFQKAPLVSNTIFHIPSLYAPDIEATGMVRKFIKVASEQYPKHRRYTLALEGLEEAAFDEDLRNFALQLIEQILASNLFNIILFCEQAPLFRLTRTEQFPTRQGEAVAASADEIVRWSHALQPFVKVYDWSPSVKPRLHDEADATAVLVHESLAWPQLRSVLKQFLLFSQSTAQGDEEAFEELLRVVKEQEKADTVVLNLDEDMLRRAHIDAHWLPEQIVEFFSANSSSLYRSKWEQCTVTERTILYQIASGLEPNPLNRAPLEHLVRRGYICRDRGWFIINLSFKQFVLSAESANTFDEWLRIANESVWQYLRIPFFALLIILLAIMAYTATDAIETAIGVLTAVFALIPMAIRNFSMIKSGQ